MYNMNGMVDSTLTTSTAAGSLIACLHDDRASLMDWIAEHKREKARQPAQCATVGLMPF